MREIAVIGGTAHPALAVEICADLGVPQRPVRFIRFANDCLEVQLQSNCRDRDVFLIQPLVPPVQENLVELLLMADAARGASAARVTAVMPHYAYARSDKKDEPRISIGGRLVADLLVTAGVNRVLTLALHSPQVHGFFSVPVDHLHALRELVSGRPGARISLMCQESRQPSPLGSAYPSRTCDVDPHRPAHAKKRHEGASGNGVG